MEKDKKPMDATPDMPQQEPDSQDISLSEENSKWLDSILSGTNVPELTADELAMSSAGLTSPEDAELEKILAEDWDSIPDFEETQTQQISHEPVTSFNETQAFIPPAVPEAVPAAQIPAEQDDADQEEPIVPDTKRRPSAKKGFGFFGIPHLASALLWLSICVVIGVTLGRAAWAICTDLMAFGKESARITITITEDDLGDPAIIANKLADAGLIKYPDLFELFYKFKLGNTNKDRAEEDKKTDLVSVGTFTLNSSYDYNAMVKAMGPHAPNREVVTVTFPEGYNCAQIFALLEKKGVCTVAKLEEAAANSSLGNYWFLEGVKRGTKYCLEGYLFPDTYDFYTNDSATRVLKKMLNAFDYRFTNRMKEALVEIQKRFPKFKLHQFVTMASIVEKESSNVSESYDIASVFYNRLAKPGEFPYLDSDATVYYAIGDYFGKHGSLSIKDLETKSPYNTSWRGGHTGLPVGPICNPGSNSLHAALAPNSTKYYYFVYSSKAKKHLFAKTLKEHNANVSKAG